jgi:hypothetical protein
MSRRLRGPASVRLIVFWYAWAGIGAALLAAYALTRQSWPWLAITAAVTAGYLAMGLRAHLRCRRSLMAGLAQSLIAVAAARQSPRRQPPRAWLNRDEHVLLASWREGWPPFRTWFVVRIPEDDLDGIDALRDGERGTAGFEMFACDPLTPWRVGRQQDLAEVAVDAAGLATVSSLPGAPGRIRRARRRWQAGRAGLLDAAPAEVAELIRQFTAAEPMAPDG